MVNVWFERFIILNILLNSLLLASKQYDMNYNANFDSRWNEWLDKIDMVFSIIFLLECIIKITVMGFYKHKNSYMKD